MISDFNRRIDIVSYSFAQDSAGGNMKLPESVHTIWAKVEQTSGSRALDNQQIDYSKAFRITVRNENSRPLNNTDEIYYDHNKISIHTITRQKEGRVNFLVLESYTNASDIEATPLPYFHAQYGWSAVPVNEDNAGDITYQGSTAILTGDDITIDFSAMPAGSFIAVRYSKSESEKTEWYNTDFNFGTLPDQVFDDVFMDDSYFYIWSRVPVALQDSDKQITFS